MKSKIITEGETLPLTVSSLPTRPTAPKALGGRGYTPSEMKEAFDRLPLFVLEKLNLLIEDITAPHGSSVSSAIETGISDGHTLKELFDDIKSGAMASYITVFDSSLAEFLAELRRDVDTIMEAQNEN